MNCKKIFVIRQVTDLSAHLPVLESYWQRGMIGVSSDSQQEMVNNVIAETGLTRMQVKVSSV